MVKQRHDKTNPCSHTITAVERILFSNLKQHLHIDDNSHFDGNLSYSWDKFKDDGHRILARLGRIYLFKDCIGVADRKLLEYKILSDNAWSDHGLVTATVEFMSSPPRPSKWKMSHQWLDEAIPIIQSTWFKSPPSAFFFSKLKEVSKAYHSIYKCKAQKFRAKEEGAKFHLSMVTTTFHAEPDDPILQSKHGRL